MSQIDEVDHFILDFDLDFFSTLNPFVSLYSEAGLYDRLRELYTFSPVPSNMETGAKIELALQAGETRLELLGKLGNIFRHLDQYQESLTMYEGEGQELAEKVETIVDSVRYW